MNEKSKYMLEKWGIPNPIIRSSLFKARSLGEERKFNHWEVIDSQGTYCISHMGPEMNQYDAQVLYAIAHIQRKSGMKFGERISTSHSEIASILKKNPSGELFKSIASSMQRLFESSIKVIYKDRGNQITYFGRIIDSYAKDQNRQIVFRLNPDMESMFSTDCTIINLEKKVKLNRLISKWLSDFAFTHKSPYPMTVEHLYAISGYGGDKSEFKRQLDLACFEIETTLGEDAPFVGHSIKEGKLYLYKQKKIAESSISKSPEQSKNPFL